MRTAPKMTEAQLQATVKQAARALGFRTYHNLYAPGSDRGFPDLIVAGHGVCFAFEFKGPKPKVYPEQQAWIAELQLCGIRARFVYPEDLDDVLSELQEAS